MRLKRIYAYIEQKGWKVRYAENDGLGSLDFEHKGIPYHVWEFPGEPAGAESNVRTSARMEDFTGDYEAQIVEILKTWGD